MAKTSSLVT
jgi:hypothetical protein